jgi:hypothetical protein
MYPSLLWKAEFDQLLQGVVGRWGGRVLPQEGFKQVMSRAGQGQYETLDHYYQKFVGTVDGSKVTMELNEYSTADPRAVDAEDNTLYLRLLIDIPTNHHILISHEGVFTKLQKLLGINHENQTGNQTFDRRYFLETSSKEDTDLLRDAAIQQHIVELEPFAALQIRKSGLFRSEMITEPKQFDFLTVERFLANLLKLAQMVQKRNL